MRQVFVFKKVFKKGDFIFLLAFLLGVYFTGMLFTANEDPKMNTFYIPVSNCKVLLLLRYCVCLRNPSVGIKSLLKRVILLICTYFHNLTFLFLFKGILCSKGKDD